jgi:CRISPR-associated protein Cas1
MKQLLNTLFVTTENAYLRLDGENVVITVESEELNRFPLHNLEGILSFSYSGASPALMGECADRGINLAFCTPRGKFLARTTGFTNGNVHLRRTQYRVADNAYKSCEIARCFIYGKLYNSRWSIERTKRDHTLRINAERFENASQSLKALLPNVLAEKSLEALRGWEGAAAKIYFSMFDDMILRDKDNFFFHERNRRPPMDNVNALLSLTYSILCNQCASALESVGLDSYVGFMHQDRPGRYSLALDLMEELRPCYADRFVLSLVNNRVIKAEDFEKSESGAVILKKSGRSALFKSWRERQVETLKHPFLGEKISWGLVPYVQALLLARYLRGDMDAYPPFLWK